MEGVNAIILTIVVLSAIYEVHCSGVGHTHGVPIAAVQESPVLATSSQYFERTFNRLVVPPVLEPIIPVAPPPPVIIQPAPSATIPVLPAEPTINAPIQPNIAIAVATAHAAAPVATILLPPYPFGPPPTIGFIPPSPPINVPDDERKEATTTPTTKTEPTPRETESTTPLPSNSDNNFVQGLPSNDNVSFKQYYGPPGPPLPLEPPRPKPQKLRTSVEIVPVPLEYISPPPITQHAPIRAIKHIHTYVPAKIIIRPVSSLRVRKVKRPVRVVAYRAPLARIGNTLVPQNGRPISRDIEPTTFRPFLRPTTKPPRV